MVGTSRKLCGFCGHSDSISANNPRAINFPHGAYLKWRPPSLKSMSHVV